MLKKFVTLTLLKCTHSKVRHTRLPGSMHDRLVLHIAESSNSYGVQVSSQNTAVPDGCLHTKVATVKQQDLHTCC